MLRGGQGAASILVLTGIDLGRLDTFQACAAATAKVTEAGAGGEIQLGEAKLLCKLPGYARAAHESAELEDSLVEAGPTDPGAPRRPRRAPPPESLRGSVWRAPASTDEMANTPPLTTWALVLGPVQVIVRSLLPRGICQIGSRP